MGPKSGLKPAHLSTSSDGYSTGAFTPISEAQAAAQLVLRARKISTWDKESTLDLKSFIRTTAAFGKKGDRVALVLINEQPATTHEDWVESIWASPTAMDLLEWLLTEFKDAFDTKPDSERQRDSDISDELALHFAIKERNYGFLVCLFSLPRVALEKFKSIFDSEQDGKNVVHQALQTGFPLASAFVAVCSAKALIKADGEGYTPIHRGLRRLSRAVNWLPSPPSSSKERDTSIVLSRTFVAKEMLDTLMRRSDKASILPKVLTTVSKRGSLYQDLANLEQANNKDLVVNELKGLIFQYVKSIPDATTALYGISVEAKELCLDMSDFNRSSHDFEKFVDSLITIMPKTTKHHLDDDDDDDEDTAVGPSRTVSFEDTLFFVQLPDLNHVKQPCYQGTIGKLFSWLAKVQGVKTINRLFIPDNSLTPLSDAFIARFVLDQFRIEVMDWRKLDANLEVFTCGCDDPGTGNTRRHIKELTLYSSGNWSVLYHWICEEGLAKLPELNKVVIEIVHPNPANNSKGVDDAGTRKYHRDMMARYKNDLYNRLKAKKEFYKGKPFPNYRYSLEIRLDARWDYPRPFQETEEPTMSVPRHSFTSLLGPCRSFVQEQLDQASDIRRTIFSQIVEKQNQVLGQKERYNLSEQEKIAIKLHERVLLNDPDTRIKVAIIDNGADKIRSPIGPWIDNGISYVSSDHLGEAPRPWWTVADAHGTQMASLINTVNPYCRLYIARVGKGRADIDPKKAAKAINWAVDQKVDVISMSWVTKSEESELKAAVERAAAKSGKSKVRPILMFCSTADEGAYAGDVYPVDYTDSVVSVTATDIWGGLTSKGDRQKHVDIRIPGEDLEASAPLYLGNVASSVSGSSVATALAAGIASLALLLLRTYNDIDEEALWPFYTKNGIMRIFSQMDAGKGALQIQNLFPRQKMDPSSLDAAAMASKWKIKNFPE
ncbi:uncharacterized protein BDV14DRAFT_195830 [Aspergillus stella-maris]|uniref:uncharacterized protein n=1 Tax=Aspergillus stella-maris TaxID=1810926 RepID=UPI003CCE41CF